MAAEAGKSDKPKYMAGIGTLMPIDELMETARAMNPRVQRFGIPWNPSQANSVRYMELARSFKFSVVRRARLPAVRTGSCSN